MKTTKAQIDNFLAQSHIAVAGYSKNPKKFGAQVFNSLKEKGYNVYPVNPAGGTTPDGQIVYESIDALPENLKALYVVTKPAVSSGLVKKALEKGYTHFWIQQMSDNAEVLDFLKEVPEKVTGECIFMHTNPTGIHKFHWWLAKVFGRLPA